MVNANNCVNPDGFESEVRDMSLADFGRREYDLAEVEMPGLMALREPSVKRIAIANPAHAPYGRAARAALLHAGIVDHLPSNRLAWQRSSFDLQQQITWCVQLEIKLHINCQFHRVAPANPT